jgi:excisionase family DNA binding protein
MTGKEQVRPSALTPREAAVYLRVGEGTVYAAIAARRLRHYRSGRNILIPIRYLDAWQDQQAEAAMGDTNVRELRRP